LTHSLQRLQSTLTQRALELLALPDDGTPRLLLDIGCGSGLSGEALTEAGHTWVGCDISPAMLDVALEREVRGGGGYCTSRGVARGLVFMARLSSITMCDCG
jgi:predicted TPR repeat methyltransferase